MRILFHFFFNKSRAYFMEINNAKKRLLSQEGFQPGKPELHADILLTVNLRFRYEFSSTFTRISCRGAVSLEFHFSGGFPLWENLKICNFLLQLNQFYRSTKLKQKITNMKLIWRFFPVLCLFLCIHNDLSWS